MENCPSGLLKRMCFVLLCLLLTGNDITFCSPVLSPNGTQREYSRKNMSNLKMLINIAERSANNSFNVLCAVLCPNFREDVCQTMRQMAQNISDYPSFSVTGCNNSRDALSEIFRVTYMYSVMSSHFAESITCEAFPRLVCHRMILYINQLESVNNYVNANFVPNVQIPASVPSIFKSRDVTQRNCRNLQLLARASLELDKMSKTLCV